MANPILSASLTIEIMRARSAMRGLYRDEYASKTADYRELLELAMKKYSCNAIKAVIHVKEAFDESGSELTPIAGALLCSAAADLTIEAGRTE